MSKPLRADLTPPPPLQLRGYAARGEGEPERASILAPPLHVALQSNAELERGPGGVRSLERCTFRDETNAQRSVVGGLRAVQSLVIFLVTAPKMG